MTVAIFSPANFQSGTIYFWDSSTTWSSRTVPNSATAVVEFPLLTQNGQVTFYEAQIQAGESFQVSAANFASGNLIDYGTLTVQHEMLVGTNGWISIDDTGNGGTLNAGTLENDGALFGLGQFTVTGDLLNRGALTSNGLTISAGSFENLGILNAWQGNMTVSFAPGGTGFANLSGGTLTGGIYIAMSGEMMSFNVNDPITTLAATVMLEGAQGGQTAGNIETYGASGTSYLALSSSLTSIASAGTLEVLFGSYNLNQAVTVQGTMLVERAILNASGLTVASGGAISLSGGNTTLSASGTITDNGTIIVTLDPFFDSATVVIGSPVSGSGSLVVGAGQVVSYGPNGGYLGVSLEVGAADSANIVFADNAGSLQLDTPQSFTGSIVGFTKGDQIVLSGLSLQSVTSTSYSGDTTHGVLTLNEAGGTSLNIAFQGSYSAADFTLSASSQTSITGLIISDSSTAPTAATTASAAISAFHAGTLTTGVTVTDSAANIVSNLDILATLKSIGDIGLIVLNDVDSRVITPQKWATAPVLTLTAGQVLLDSAALQDIASAYTVSVTGATVQQAELLAGTAHITSMAVADSLADIGTQLDALENLAATGQVSTIAVTDSTVQTLSLSASQYQADHVALADMTGNFDVTVTAPATSLSLTGVSGHGTTFVLNGTAGSYLVTPAGDGIGLTAAGSSTYTLRDVTALQFSDFTEIVAQTPGPASAVTTGNITEIYGAVFGREPDVGGLAFYQSYLAANPGTPLTQFAQFFLASPEYVNNPAHNYAQTSAGDAQFITDSYQNLLSRTPSASEVSFYQNVIAPFIQGLTPGTTAYANAEAHAHALVLTYFSQSPEFFGDVQITASHPASAQHWLLLI